MSIKNIPHGQSNININLILGWSHPCEEFRKEGMILVLGSLSMHHNTVWVTESSSGSLLWRVTGGKMTNQSGEGSSKLGWPLPDDTRNVMAHYLQWAMEKARENAFSNS